MGKRIHKRPGTMAYERALRKSVTRMARDYLRMQNKEPKQRRLVLARWMHNKRPETRMFLSESLKKTISRRLELFDARKAEGKHLLEQLEDWQAQIDKRVEKMKGKGESLEEYKNLRSLAELGLDSAEKFLRNYAWVKKNAPKNRQMDAIIEGEIKQRAENMKRMRRVINHGIRDLEGKG